MLPACLFAMEKDAISIGSRFIQNK
jgi:hypothetical protein